MSITAVSKSSKNKKNERIEKIKKIRVDIIQKIKSKNKRVQLKLLQMFKQLLKLFSILK